MTYVTQESSSSSHDWDEQAGCKSICQRPIYFLVEGLLIDTYMACMHINIHYTRTQPLYTCMHMHGQRQTHAVTHTHGCAYYYSCTSSHRTFMHLQCTHTCRRVQMYAYVSTHEFMHASRVRHMHTRANKCTYSCMYRDTVNLYWTFHVFFYK